MLKTQHSSLSRRFCDIHHHTRRNITKHHITRHKCVFRRQTAFPHKMHRIHPPRSHTIVSTHITRDDDPLASGCVFVVVHTHRVDLTKINPQSVSPLHDAQEHQIQRENDQSLHFGDAYVAVSSSDSEERKTDGTEPLCSISDARRPDVAQRKGIRGHQCRCALLMRIASLRSSIRSLHFNAFLRISHPLCSRTLVDAAIYQSPLRE